MHSWRRAGARALTSMGVTMLVGVGVLAVAGWLTGAIDAVQRNREYARDVAD